MAVAISLMCFSCGNGIFGGKSWDTIEGVRKNIDGTVWTYTQPNDLWIKLEFRNGKCYVYSSCRNQGSWGNARCTDYVINEAVKKSTSEKIVLVSIGTDTYISGNSGMKSAFGTSLPTYSSRPEYNLSPKEEILYTASGLPLSVHPTDYKW